MDLVIAEDLGIATIAVDIARTGRIFLALLVAATVMDETCLRISGCGQATALATSLLGAGAALESLFLCRAGTAMVGRSELVTGVGDLTTAHRGMRFVQHAVCSQRQPSIRRSAGVSRVLGQQASGQEELDEAWTEIGVKGSPQGLVEAAHGRGRWGTAVREAEQLSPTRALRSGQELGQFLPAQSLFPTQQAAQKEGDGVEGRLSTGIEADAAQGHQLGAQERKVDQA